MPYIPIAIATAVCVMIAASNLPAWAAIGVFMAWVASIMLGRPEAPQTIEALPETHTDWSSAARLVELIDTPILIIDEDRIVAANDAAKRIAGTHIVGQDSRVALRHPDAIRLLASDGELERAQIKGLISSKSVWSMKVSRVEGRLRIVQLEDLTAQADISRAHTDFVANASHELRTPLSAIIGYIETLADTNSPIDAPTKVRFFETMGREARRMQALVEDLMSLSRIEAEKHDSPQQQVDLAAIAKAVVNDVNAVAGKIRVKLSVPNGGASVIGEHSQLDQVIRNLIDNANKYGSPDEPVEVSIARGPRKNIVMSITDHGPGVAPEHIPYLTRRFYRTDPGRSRASGGTGLGLAIVKHIVERHKGQLDIVSVVGSGLTVTVMLPAGH
jgi:two-component system, OmpR family, phosphate regulon sensor histidine kinase PhoR